jgi:hypothetical protein
MTIFERISSLPQVPDSEVVMACGRVSGKGMGTVLPVDLVIVFQSRRGLGATPHLTLRVTRRPSITFEGDPDLTTYHSPFRTMSKKISVSAAEAIIQHITVTVHHLCAEFFNRGQVRMKKRWRASD